jgi:predicted RNA-binding Zn ribbon-like protein
MNSTSKTTPSPRPDFLLLGGHVAVDFVNTVLPPPGPGLEFLRSWEDVVDWLMATKLVDLNDLHVPKSEARSALEAVHQLRAAWGDTLARLLEGKGVRPAFIERLNALLRVDAFTDVLRPSEDGSLHLHRSPSQLKGTAFVLSLLARAIAEFLVSMKLNYLHRCANTDSCVLLFYDTTKNHRRQWCSNAICGNRHKVAEFRRRKRTKPKKT